VTYLLAAQLILQVYVQGIHPHRPLNLVAVRDNPHPRPRLKRHSLLVRIPNRYLGRRRILPDKVLNGCAIEPGRRRVYPGQLARAQHIRGLYVARNASLGDTDKPVISSARDKRRAADGKVEFENNTAVEIALPRGRDARFIVGPEGAEDDVGNRAVGGDCGTYAAGWASGALGGEGRDGCAWSLADGEQ